MKRILVILGLLMGAMLPVSAQTEVNDSVTVSASELADKIVAEAEKYLKVPYKYGASGPSAFDCSGFTRYVYDKFGYHLTRSAASQAKEGRQVSGTYSDLQKGDILVFGGISDKYHPGHVAIFVELSDDGDDFTFIHAAIKGGIQFSHIKETYYASRFLGVRRILPDIASISTAEEAEVSKVVDVLEGKAQKSIVLLENGRWAFVGEDGEQLDQNSNVKMILSSDGSWTVIPQSSKTIPILGSRETVEQQPAILPAETKIVTEQVDAEDDKKDDAAEKAEEKTEQVEEVEETAEVKTEQVEEVEETEEEKTEQTTEVVETVEKKTEQAAEVVEKVEEKEEVKEEEPITKPVETVKSAKTVMTAAEAAKMAALLNSGKAAESQASETKAEETKPAEVKKDKPVAEKQQTAPAAVIHTVKSGDTLSGLAARYHTTVSLICSLNKINEKTILQIGQKLRMK